MPTGGHTYDDELRRLGTALRREWGVRSDDRVLDVGCGTGGTTRDAAREASSGSATGVDVSADAIDRAWALSRADGPDNVDFVCADAAVHVFPEAFDLVVSRFGTMFFADPVAAFENLARALRPDGRLVMLVWQERDLNEWDVVIRAALGVGDEPTAGPDPFSLADTRTVTSVLHRAGFADVTFSDVHAPVLYGPDVDTAVRWVRGFTCTRHVLDGLPPAGRAHAEARLQEAMAQHLHDDGVRFDARAWVVTARRPA